MRLVVRDLDRFLEDSKCGDGIVALARASAVTTEL